MQPHETARPHMPEANRQPPRPVAADAHAPIEDEWYEKVKKMVDESSPKASEPVKEKVTKGEKEKGVGEKLKTSIGDAIRDVMTANEMAKAKFEGDTALMQIAKGGMTTIIGVGLERALDDTFKDAVSVNGDGIFLDRPRIKFSDTTRKEIDTLRVENPRAYLFVTNAAKDLATGIVYNGLAFFSRPMLKSAGGEHLLTSLAIDAAEAAGTKGLESQIRRHAAMDKKEGMQMKRTMWEDRLKQHEQGQGASASTDAAADRLQISQLTEQINTFTLPEDTTLDWQTNFRKYLNYSNPATLLGMNMIISGGSTLMSNFKEVRNMRKEKGGLPGKEVFMPKKDAWQPRNGNRDQRTPYQNQNRGTWQNKKEPVYYGKSQWDKNKQQEEEDLAKLM